MISIPKVLLFLGIWIGVGNYGTYKYTIYNNEEFKLGYLVSGSLLGPILPGALYIAVIGEKCIANCKIKQ